MTGVGTAIAILLLVLVDSLDGNHSLSPPRLVPGQPQPYRGLDAIGHGDGIELKKGKALGDMKSTPCIHKTFGKRYNFLLNKNRLCSMTCGLAKLGFDGALQ